MTSAPTSGGAVTAAPTATPATGSAKLAYTPDTQIFGSATDDATSPRILYTNIPDALSVTNNNTTTASLSGSTAGTYYLGITVAGVTEFVTISFDS